LDGDGRESGRGREEYPRRAGSVSVVDSFMLRNRGSEEEIALAVDPTLPEAELTTGLRCWKTLGFTAEPDAY